METDLYTTCPGCGSCLAVNQNARYDGYFNVSPECWLIFTDVIGVEFGNAVLFGQVHQLTVDTYAVQHVGGNHPDKSMAIHLVGLYLVLERNIKPTQATTLIKGLADVVKSWPHFTPPDNKASMTINDVTPVGSMDSHILSIHKWGREVWDIWSSHQLAIEKFASNHLSLN